MNRIKKDPHWQSVKTLNLADNGDEAILAEIDDLIHNHQIGQPYTQNVLWRIKLLVDKQLKDELA
jgi:hypothetical protein